MHETALIPDSYAAGVRKWQGTRSTASLASRFFVKNVRQSPPLTSAPYVKLHGCRALWTLISSSCSKTAFSNARSAVPLWPTTTMKLTFVSSAHRPRLRCFIVMRRTVWWSTKSLSRSINWSMNTGRMSVRVSSFLAQSAKSLFTIYKTLRSSTNAHRQSQKESRVERKDLRSLIKNKMSCVRAWSEIMPRLMVHLTKKEAEKRRKKIKSSR